MFFSAFHGQKRLPLVFHKPLIWLALVLFWIAATLGAQAHAQDTSQQAPANPNQTNPNQQEAPPEAGGPQNDVGPYVIPKKTEEPPPPAPERPKKIATSPAAPTLAEQCMGSTPSSGSRKLSTVKMVFLISPA